MIRGGSVALGLAISLATAGVVGAEPVTRINWIPKNGNTIMGDLWTFKCPRGGSVNASADTREDIVDNNVATVDLFMDIYDGKGNRIVQADDEFACSVPSACGFDCPRAFGVPCGEGSTHSVVIGDTTANAADSPQCQIGGGYRLRLEVLDKNGESLAAKKVKLGGGPRSKLPRWAQDEVIGPTRSGPAIDDAKVPSP